jgi:isopenicillin-N epimerase
LNADFKKYWGLDPAVVFLNHGSFGSCPTPVLDFQQALRLRLERQPVQFLARGLEGMLDEARAAVAAFVGATRENLVFVPNATSGVNTILRSLAFEAGDELLVTDHEYNACRNALEYAAARDGAKVVVAAVRFPVQRADQIVAAIMERVTARTRLALLDHVTSQTGLILPIARLVRELAARGVETLVDGAHAPGMVSLRVEEIGAAYYTGNLHKWVCAPKTAGFLYVRPDRQEGIHPLAISHGFNSPRQDRSRFLLEFGWTGTLDPSACLSVPEVLRFMEGLLPGGWPEIMSRNRSVALEGRKILCQTLRIEAPCPDELIGSMASVPLPPARPGERLSSAGMDRWQDELLARHGIEVPIIAWPEYPRRLLRISAQLYNDPGQYRLLAEALGKLGS